MKEVTTKLYRFDELDAEWANQALEEFDKSFLPQTSIWEVWFTSTGLIYPIFN